MKKEELLDFLHPSFKNKGFLKSDTEVKLLAAFISTHDDNWKSLMACESVETIAEQLGCTINDLQTLIKEASDKVNARRRGEESKSHWANRFEGFIKKRKIPAEDVAFSLRKLLVANDLDDAGDELLDELIEMVEP
jgi:hypothetical protein